MRRCVEWTGKKKWSENREWNEEEKEGVGGEWSGEETGVKCSE